MNTFKQTALTSLDSYKLGHADQYPEGTEFVYSNFTPRSEKHFNVPDDYKVGGVVWCGLQEFLYSFNTIWNDTFFNVPLEDVLDEFKEFAAPFCGPKGYDTSRMAALHKLGYLPLRIKALPEGVIVPIGVPALTVINTHVDFGWLTNSIETWMSTELWKTCTSATTAVVYRNILDKYVALTGGNKEFAAWQIHDFSVRGMSGIYDAAKSGYGHLLSSLGTDNLPAVKLVNDVYQGKSTFVGGSVPATEHSVMCAGGKESELETFRRIIRTYPSGVVSIVSDTWNLWNVIGGPNSLAAQLKDEILSRTPDSLGFAKVVFRPDSGDPVKIITGYKTFTREYIGKHPDYVELAEGGYEAIIKDGKYYVIDWLFDRYDNFIDGYTVGKEISEWEAKGAINCLAEIFGTTTNDKGFKTLNQRVGLIYGDSITPAREEEILQRLMDNGYASDNIVFGVGSYTYQYVTRDSFGWAMKATYVEINGESIAIFKDPITDSGTKKSAKGLLTVLEDTEGRYYLKDNVSYTEEAEGALQLAYLNGTVYLNESISTIRERLASYRKRYYVKP